MYRHHVFVHSGGKSVQLAEVGPRFEMRRKWSRLRPFFITNLILFDLAYEIRQGTIEHADADIEWVLRPYHRTARKRKLL